MMDGTITPERTFQRSRGTAALAFRDGELARLYQSGAAKALLPRCHGGAHEVVLVNTAGGITGGDRYGYECTASGTDVIVTTQAAERAYRSCTDHNAVMNVKLSATNHASLHWLPQETILFNESRIDRRIEVDLDTHSECIVLESLVFGRHAMGETLQNCRFSDRWRIRRDGRLVHAEALTLARDVPALLSAASGADGAQMAATLLYVGPRLEQVRGEIAATLPTLRSRAAVSSWQGRLVVRLIAAETMWGKADIAQILNSMRGQQLPRVWQS